MERQKDLGRNSIVSDLCTCEEGEGGPVNLGAYLWLGYTFKVGCYREHREQKLYQDSKVRRKNRAGIPQGASRKQEIRKEKLSPAVNKVIATGPSSSQRRSGGSGQRVKPSSVLCKKLLKLEGEGRTENKDVDQYRALEIKPNQSGSRNFTTRCRGLDAQHTTQCNNHVMWWENVPPVRKLWHS